MDMPSIPVALSHYIVHTGRRLFILDYMCYNVYNRMDIKEEAMNCAPARNQRISGNVETSAAASHRE